MYIKQNKLTLRTNWTIRCRECPAILLLKKAASRRKARLNFPEQSCGKDYGLRDRVESMLHEKEPTDSLTERTASLALKATVSCRVTNDPDSTTDHHGDRPVTVIAGRYQLLELIGEAGMGSVWLAKQSEPAKHFVAVKLIKTGTDTRAVLARFEAEHQALAVMEYPSLAEILDGGMTQGVLRTSSRTMLGVV